MSAQASLFALMDDPTFTPAPVIKPAAAVSSLPDRKPVLAELSLVAGWLKSYCGPALPTGAVTTLPTLNKIDNDGHRYIPSCFALKPGVSVEDYPRRVRASRHPAQGSKLLISLYDAVQKELATEVQE